MARFLLGWELGANSGHIMRLLQLADSLADSGHDIALAVQDLGLLPIEKLASYQCYQAPCWPRLLAGNALYDNRPVASMGDILWRLGLSESATLPAMITAWHQVFSASSPDLIICDYAPAMGMAARGRLPVLQIGTGFAVPPSYMARFPSLSGEKPLYQEETALDNVNRGLSAIGELPVDTLPGLFSATRQLPGEFFVLDPYKGQRAGTFLSPPTVADPCPDAIGAQGEEIFVYAFERAMHASALWDGLQKTGLPVRVYIPRVSADFSGDLTQRGFNLERQPVPFADISRRSRMVLSHGGHGFVCSAMLAGIPQIVTHYDLEKQLTGMRIAQAGLGGHVSLPHIVAERMAEQIKLFHADEAPQRAARSAAGDFQTENGEGATAAIMAAISEFID